MTMDFLHKLNASIGTRILYIRNTKILYEKEILYTERIHSFTKVSNNSAIIYVDPKIILLDYQSNYIEAQANCYKISCSVTRHA